MKIVCDYANLLSNLNDISEVVEDGLLSEDLRNVIFKVSENSVELVGANQLVLFFRPLDHQYFTVDVTPEELGNSGIRYMQLKSKEVKDFLSSYKGVRRTEVEEVTLETLQSGRVKCSVLEKDIENGTPHVSSWMFTEVPMKPNVLKQITIAKPDKELEEVESRKVMFYTKNLLPMLQPGTSLFSKMIFADEYVIHIGNTHTTFMRNMLCDSFKNICLVQRSVSFMDKVICQAEVLGVARTDTHLYFETSQSRAFIMYDNRMPTYQNYLDGYKKDRAFSVDRIYLQDTLKRLKLLNDSVEITIDSDNSEMTLKNSKFIQQIALLQTKALEGIFHFKVMPETLSRVIIGSDDEFSQTLFVYYCPQSTKQAVLVFTDDSNSWFSSIAVKPY